MTRTQSTSQRHCAIGLACVLIGGRHRHPVQVVSSMRIKSGVSLLLEALRGVEAVTEMLRRGDGIVRDEEVTGACACNLTCSREETPAQQMPLSVGLQDAIIDAWHAGYRHTHDNAASVTLIIDHTFDKDAPISIEIIAWRDEITITALSEVHGELRSDLLASMVRGIE